MRASFSFMAMMAGILVLIVVGPYTDAGAQEPDLQKIRDLLGNQNFDPNKLPEGTQGAPDVKKGLSDISSVVSATKPKDCSAAGVQVVIPPKWGCRKLNDGAQDFTLYTDNNTLNLTIGLNQGMSSCDVIPTCTENKDETNLGSNFVDKRELVQPLLGSVEIVATYAKNPKLKLLITSNDAIKRKEREDILTIVESIRQQ